MIRSAFQQHFANIPSVNKPRSSFKRPGGWKGTFDEGYLVPFYLDEVLPGDTFNVRASIFARLATPVFPLMDNMFLETFWFFCPNRLVWTNFVKQMGEQTNPGDSTDYTTPVLNSIGTPAVMSLWDHFGLPMVRASDQTTVSALPMRMYYKIYDDWFRDEDLQNAKTLYTGDGPDPLTAYSVMRINKYKDYFTTARPAPQKGPAVSVPIGGYADVWGSMSAAATSATINNAPIATWFTDRVTTDGAFVGRQTHATSTTAAPPANAPGWGSVISGNEGPSWNGTYTGSGNNVTNQNNDIGYLDEAASKAARASAVAPFKADLNTAVGPTVNLWREAITVQQMYELDMRGGTRYIESVFNHFGVVNPDFRLQRPEFLGYSRSAVNIHPVPQTSETATTPQGNLSAFGTVSSHANGFVKSFTEHGFVMGLVTVRAALTYQELVEKMWTRRTRFDYYFPTFANLGEQAVLNREIQVNPLANTGNEDVFGYQEAWAEYRYKTNKVTGLFRSSAPSSLDGWHLAQEFPALVSLNGAFVVEDAPVDRVIAVPGEPHFICDTLVENTTSRVMPVYSVPGLTRF